MAKILNVSAVKGEVVVWQEPKSSDFVKWERISLPTLRTKKNDTNASLLELIYHLGDDGRQELALVSSISFDQEYGRISVEIGGMRSSAQKRIFRGDVGCASCSNSLQ
jgi:hypothetical protein